MLDISESILEPVINELTNGIDWVERRPTELLLNPAERERVWESMMAPDLYESEGFNDYLFGMKIVYLHCVPPGRALMVDDLNTNMALIQGGPGGLVPVLVT